MKVIAWIMMLTIPVGGLRIDTSSGAAPARRLDLPPAGATDCEEMSWYRQRAGLPEHFDTIGYRESRCQNTAHNYCCYGYWQNYISSHLSKSSGYRSRIIGECGVNGRDDIWGNSPAQKQQQACVTKVVFDISGYSPWRQTA